MGKDSSPPPTPDYGAAAQQQGASNRETAITQAILNNPNIVTPYGKQTVTKSAPGFDQAGYDAALQKYQTDMGAYNNSPMTGRWAGGPDGADIWSPGQRGSMPTAPTREQFADTGTPQFTVTQELSPEQQKLYEGQTKISQGFLDTGQTALGRVQEMFAKPADFSGVQDVSDRAYAAHTARLDPQWQQQQQAFETQMRNQGIPVGSEAWNNEKRAFDQQHNDAYQQARVSADATMPQTFQLAQAARDTPLNEANALRTGAQVQSPTFQPFSGSSVGQTPIMQSAMSQGQSDANIYSANQASANNTQSGLFSLGSAAMMAFAI